MCIVGSVWIWNKDIFICNKYHRNGEARIDERIINTTCIIPLIFLKLQKHGSISFYVLRLIKKMLLCQIKVLITKALPVQKRNIFSLHYEPARITSGDAENLYIVNWKLSACTLLRKRTKRKRKYSLKGFIAW